MPVIRKAALLFVYSRSAGTHPETCVVAGGADAGGAGPNCRRGRKAARLHQSYGRQCFGRSAHG